ncbi:MAG: GH3 auxin-responsive promoter family protein [Bernardetiaceae bacterium]
MLSLLNKLGIEYFRRRMERVDQYRNRPHQAQARVFEELIRQGTHTEWGRKYSYASIRHPEQYRERVPASTYEELFPYIERLLRGEQKVLWPSTIRHFSKSSGTTNDRSKYIPISEESLQKCHYDCGKDMLAIYADLYPDANVFAGKGLSVGGSLQTNPYNPKTYCGDISALIMQNLPFWAEWLRTPSLEVALLSDWEEKIWRMANEASREDVRSIQGVPTWTIFLIKKVVELKGATNILDVWPDLELFIHGAVNFDPYRKLFRELIPSPGMRYLEVYNASEGFFGIQDQKAAGDMLLTLDNGIYYEFAPMSEWDKPFPKTLGLDAVDTHTNYALIISTNAGLWRYKIGDTVKFTSLNPFRIRITGRTKHFINAFGEEVVVENAEAALTRAAEQTGAIVSNFTAAPVFIQAQEKGGHQWIIEFEQPPNSLSRFTEALDTTLREINADYDAKRAHDIALQMPLITQVPKGTFYHWMKKRGKLGGQHKVPRLSNDRTYVEDLLRFAEGL